MKIMWALCLCLLFVEVDARESILVKKERSLALRRVLSGLYESERGVDSQGCQKIDAMMQQNWSFVAQKIPKKSLAASQVYQASLQSWLKRCDGVFKAKPFIVFLVEIFSVADVPTLPPSLDLGREVYQRHCQSCHGDEGRGAGDLAKKFPKKIKDFRLTEGRTVFQTYTTLASGFTASAYMPNFLRHLSKSELWNVSFYIQNFMAGKGFVSNHNPVTLGLSLHRLVYSSDDELQKWWENLTSTKTNAVHYLRQFTFQSQTPRR